MEQYNVTGMSCAACSARVEKAVSKVPGVTSCSVSLLTNSMGVEGTASSSAIIVAVTEAGYGASLKGAEKAQGGSASDYDDMLKDTETPKMKKRLVVSVCLLIPLMYFSMGHMMWGWPLPALLGWQPHGHGTGTAAVYGSYHGGKPEILYQRFQEPGSHRAPEHGHACGAGLQLHPLYTAYMRCSQ